jgi:5-methylcytosine-specific restriction protein A
MFNFLKQIRFAKRSPKWTQVRKNYINNNPNCAACGSDKKQEVHHIKPVHLFPDLELDPSNLLTLCADPCHILFGHLMNFKSWNREVVQDCSVYNNKIRNRP